MAAFLLVSISCLGSLGSKCYPLASRHRPYFYALPCIFFSLGFRGQEFIVSCMSLNESEEETVVSRATGSTPSHHIGG